MTYADLRWALERNEYVGMQATESVASAHMLIHMLLKGGLERISKARACMVSGDNDKGVLTSQAISILDALRGSLDLEAGAEIAQNLDKLYEYCQRRLLKANLSNDPVILDEVSSLLGEIASAWDAISPIDGQIVPISKDKLRDQIHA